jgi:hypothetical protein
MRLNALVLPHALSKVLRTLLGRAVASKPGPPTPASRPRVIATYLTDDDALVGLIICDIPLACHLGAALSLIPAPVANESIKKGRVDEVLFEHLHEVLNICVTVFVEPEGPRVRLGALLAPNAPLSPEITRVLQRPAVKDDQRVDLHVDITGYGAGVMSVIAV